MAFAQRTMNLSFLRPLGLPRASSLRFLTTSTTSSSSSLPSSSTSATLAPPLPYHVTRTPSLQLPIYHLAKAGGNKKLTRVKGIQGNIGVLRSDIQLALGLPESEVVVNWLTKHVVIKGWKKKEVAEFLEDRKF